MQIRRLGKEEHRKTRALYEEVFSEDSASFVDYYYSEKTKDNRIYVVEQDREICSMLHLNPYKLMVQGNEKQSYYIVAVATKKECRKKGYMSALLCRAMQDLYEEGILFVYLMPASEKIYLPFDFRTVYEQEQRVYREEALGSEHPGVGGFGAQAFGIGTYEIAKETDCARMAASAEQFLSGHYQVYVKRTEGYYRRLIKECASEHGKVLVQWKTEEKGGRWAQDIRLHFPKNEEEDEHSKIMTRVIDVRRLLMCLKTTCLMSVCFQVADPLIPENNRCMNLLGTEVSKILLMDGQPENSEGTIPVSALAELVFGVKSVEEISGEPGVEMTGRLREELKKIVPLSRIYLNEVV